MRILVVGGTQFVGRHIVSTLLAQGDQVTLFHRGRTNPDLFPEAEHRLGDRDVDLSALAGGTWDATVDSSAYVPRQVRALARVLGDRGGRYVHISSVSAYGEVSGPGYDEGTPLAVLEDPAVETVDAATYGGLKALCEQAALESFAGPGGPGTSVSIVRPTYVAGPYDHTGRFTWWVERVAQGGRVVAPAPRDHPFQVVDARDLAEFVALLAHGGAQGIFHAAGPPPPYSFADFLATVVAEVGPPGTELVWVAEEVLARAGVTEAELPLWAATAADRYLSAADPARAIAAGLRLRPLSQTVRDVHEQQQSQPPALRLPARLSPERERELLGAEARS
jgi:2'-hydroxyisoflavone reductase